MKNLECFLKRSEAIADNIKFVVDEDIKDEEGNPIEWELRRIKAKEADEAQNEAFKVDIEKQDIQFNQSILRNKIMAKSVVYPDLNNAELQDAFGVRTPEDLLGSMLGLGAFDRLEKKVNIINGYGKTFNDLKEEAKN